MVVDAQGNRFVVGQRVAKAAKLFKTDGLYIEIVSVTKVDGDKIYLNESRMPLKFPDRVAIIS